MRKDSNSGHKNDTPRHNLKKKYVWFLERKLWNLEIYLYEMRDLPCSWKD